MAGLMMWTIYAHPLDYPDGFVVRKWLVEGGRDPRDAGVLGRVGSLDDARALIPGGLTFMPAGEGDDPCVVETWF